MLDQSRSIPWTWSASKMAASHTTHDRPVVRGDTDHTMGTSVRHTASQNEAGRLEEWAVTS